MTPLGQLSLFIDFPKRSGLFDQLVREAPLAYTSPNAPTPRDVLGKLVLSMVAGPALRACEHAPLRRGESGVAGDQAGLQRRFGTAGGGAVGRGRGGAQVGYNPHRRGRPSQVIHVYEMGTTWLMLKAEVVAGRQHHSQYGLPGLEGLRDRLGEPERPALVRGDCGYGTERVMEALDQRGQDGGEWPRSSDRLGSVRSSV